MEQWGFDVLSMPVIEMLWKIPKGCVCRLRGI